ncbi:MAG: tetratricopeptide repeat protein [Candidatus Electryoneaceae bacterium]|nr:tetratricopeptide repeat protein [Candidatus Electryoneaceae bacterium]
MHKSLYLLLSVIILMIIFPSSVSAQDDFQTQIDQLSAEREQVLRDMQTASDNGSHDAYERLNISLGELDERINALIDQKKAEVAQQNESARAMMLIGDGVGHLRAGRYPDAVTSFQEALVIEMIEPQAKSQAYFNMGFAYMRMRQSADARQAFESALQFNPNYAAAHTVLGNLASSERDYPTAIEHFNQAIELDSTQVKAFVGIANIHFKSRRFSQAETNYYSATEIKSDYSDAWVGLGRSLVEQHRNSEAITALERAVDLNTRSYLPYYFLASTQNKTGDHTNALSAAGNCIRLKGNYYPAWYEKGLALLKLGRKREAITAFEKSKQGGSDWRRLAEHQIKVCRGEVPAG